jgi:hypothetical protein
LAGSISLFESACGEGHPWLREVHLHYAEVLRELGQPRQATEHEQKAKNIQKRIDKIVKPKSSAEEVGDIQKIPGRSGKTMMSGADLQMLHQPTGEPADATTSWQCQPRKR